MKGGGSRLNVNTDKPHSLISIKNKVLPTSPPARQSPQAPPTAARSWRPGEREPGNRWWRRAACPGSAHRHPSARSPARRAGLRARTPRATPPARPPEPAPPARADPAPHTLLRAHAARASRQPCSPWTRRSRRGDRRLLTLLAPRDSARSSGGPPRAPEPGTGQIHRGRAPPATDPFEAGKEWVP